MNTAQEILQELLKLGLKQSEIARRSGVPQPTLSRWQAGAAPGAANQALTLRSLLQQVRREEDHRPT